MGVDSLPRRVLAGLLSMQPYHVSSAELAVTEYSVPRRVVAGLLGVSLHSLPSSVVQPVAVEDDARGRSDRQSIAAAEAQDREQTAKIIDLAARRRSAIRIHESEAALAAADEGPWQAHPTSVPDLGLLFSRVLTERDETVFAVEGQPGGVAGDDDVVLVRFRDKLRGRYRDLLIPLARNQVGVPVGDVIVPGNHVLASVELLALLTVAEMPAELASAVSDSVRSSSVVGRNAWRRVVRDLPSGHPIRDAVASGLR